MDLLDIEYEVLFTSQCIQTALTGSQKKVGICFAGKQTKSGESLLVMTDRVLLTSTGHFPVVWPLTLSSTDLLYHCRGVLSY